MPKRKPQPTSKNEQESASASPKPIPTAMPDSADPQHPQPHEPSSKPDPDMPPRRSHAGGGGGRLKKRLSPKFRAAAEQRLAHLRLHLRLRPLDSAPHSLAAATSPHEAALRSVGLLDFARLDLRSDSPPRPDLVAQLVAYYDASQHRSFVWDARVGVSRTDLVRALSLPPKPASTAPPPDVDPAAVVSAVLEFMQAYVLPPFQGDDMCILPQEVAAAEQAVKEGSAHRVDWAGLIWGLVEKEILELPKRDDGVCFYGAYLQRLIWVQKPQLFELLEEDERGEVALEVSVDADMDEEEGDADVRSKSLEDPEPGDVHADVRSKILEESELEGAHLRSNSLEELELGDADADVRNKVLEESEIEGADLRTNNLDELESGDVDVRSKSTEELELGDVDANARINILETLKVVDEDTNGTSLDESKAGNELGLQFIPLEAVAVKHEVMTSNDKVSAEVAWEGDEDAPVDAAEKDAGPVVEMVLVTQEEVLQVPEEDEEADGEEEKDATGLSLGISSANDYDSVDVEENASVENLDEGDSDNEEAEESEDDAFDEYPGGVEMNWRIGDEKGDEGTTNCLQQCNSSAFAGMEFENLNKGDVGMRDEVSFDDGFSGKMGSLHGMESTNLLQAMNSIPATYNGTENSHDLSSREFLAMGADAHKNGVDLGPGSSFFFENNGKRHIGDIDGYDDHMQTQQQFLQGNQPKRMRNCNNSSVSPGSAFFNANFSEPIQSLVDKASLFYKQKETELQAVQFEKQCMANLLQEKDTIIESLNSVRFEQENKWQAELRRFEHELNVMGQLVSGYKKALKQNRASFDEYRKKFPCDKFRYHDVAGGGGLVLSVKELERKRLEEEQQKLAAANEMIEKFQLEWFSKPDEWKQRIASMCSKTEELAREIDLLKEKREAKVTTPAAEE